MGVLPDAPHVALARLFTQKIENFRGEEVRGSVVERTRGEMREDKDMDMDMDESVLTEGDVAILRFLAAAELIESDLWQQYNELGGVNGGNSAYMAGVLELERQMPPH